MLQCSNIKTFSYLDIKLFLKKQTWMRLRWSSAYWNWNSICLLNRKLVVCISCIISSGIPKYSDAYTTFSGKMNKTANRLFGEAVRRIHLGVLHCQDAVHFRGLRLNKIRYTPTRKVRHSLRRISVHSRTLHEPGSVVCIATDYGLGRPGIEFRWRRDFLQLSRPALGPT
jgi:hypothetical protein